MLIKEKLSKLIMTNHEGRLSGFSVGNLKGRSLAMSHLLFADDTLIFFDADLDQILILLMILIWFEAVSGLKIKIGRASCRERV